MNHELHGDDDEGVSSSSHLLVPLRGSRFFAL